MLKGGIVKAKPCRPQGQVRGKRKEYMNDYDKAISILRQCCEEIQSRWNGDDNDTQEQRANKATELLELLEKIDEIKKELGI